MVVFVDSKGIADFRLRSRVSVGPLFSSVDGLQFYSANLSVKQLRDKGGWQYFQKQIGK